jgi:glutamate-5-semialdehyde dehydrogenase
MNNQTHADMLSSSQADALISTLAAQARVALASLSLTSGAQRNEALDGGARLIRTHLDDILAANKLDIEQGIRAGLTEAFIDRLTLSADRIEAMAKGLEDIASLDDPLGVELARWTVPSGLDITRLSTPLGVIGVIYEARPNVTIDAAGLALKSGNAVILRAGSDSQHTSTLLAGLMRQALMRAGIEQDAVQIIETTDRQAVGAMLQASGKIDVIIPRGGKGLVERVQSEARVPVFAHLEGICHLYIAAEADPQKAVTIALNAKMRRVGICGATETILIDEAVDDEVITAISAKLLDAGCEIRGDSHIRSLDSRVVAASDADFGCEFLAPVVAMKMVENIEAAIAHISQHSSGHTESIITENSADAEMFLSRIDSAIVMHNASTQFADGGEFGMGAEIGIATGRMHARGPVGAAQLTSFKYVVRGNGQTRA